MNWYYNCAKNLKVVSPGSDTTETVKKWCQSKWLFLFYLNIAKKEGETFIHKLLFK